MGSFFWPISANGFRVGVKNLFHHQVEQPEASAQTGLMERPLLNDQERGRLDELFVASRSLVEPVELERDVNSWNLISF